MKEKFSLIATKKAKKDLNSKRFQHYKEKILEEIKILKSNPFFSRKIKKLQGVDDIYRLMFNLPDGKARCIYKIFKEKRKCKILRIGYRENINYSKFS